jgi:leucyl-tRNA synthetase
MRQWMLRITAYAERLLDDLETVDWPEHVKEMQRHWIGRSEGAEISFRVAGHDASFEVFTTRPDTLFGCTFCVLAPEHPLVGAITTEDRRREVESYVADAAAKTDLQRTDLARQKTGVFTGARAEHPVTGAALPVWVADYVLPTYGTGAIMAVPGQDERDWEFAERFELPIVRTVQPPEGFAGKAYLGDGPAIRSRFLDGLEIADAKRTMIEWLEEHGKGRGRVEYKLRDWLFSRQRYWGEPFPIVHAEDGEVLPVSPGELPIELPPIDEYRPTEDGRPPLARASREWLELTLPDGRKATRETNTMPQWAGSCWYYLRYLDPHNEELPFSPEVERHWMPVDLYVGGVEHAVLHLLYARFWHKVFFDCGLVSTAEPFQRLYNQGMILAYSYQDAAGRYHHPAEVEERDGRLFAGDVEVTSQVEKMSKSKLNVVNPDDVIAAHGADAMRLYELFMGPLDQQKPWQTAGVEGVYRFLQRTWRLVVDEHSGALSERLVEAPAASEPELQRTLHRTIRKVLEDTESLAMNTAISQMMVFVNEATQSATLPREIVETFLKVLGPYAPHLAEELWHRLGHDDLIAHADWPRHDEALCAEETVTIVVQVNGKKRDELQVPAQTGREELERLALASEAVRRHLGDGAPRKVIVVPGRLVNLVV